MNDVDNEIREYLDEYDRIFSMIQKSDDSMWPDWLANPVFNDFGDNYYQQSFVDDSLKASVMRLKHRYNDFYEYLDAMEIYNEYMEKLVEEYGSMRVIKNALEVGMMEEAIPSKPKIKHNKRNLKLLRSGVIPTKKTPELYPSDEDILAIARQVYPIREEDENFDVFAKKPTKDKQREFEKVLRKAQGVDRRRNMYRAVESNAGTDFITEYLNQAKHGIYSVEEDGEYTGRRSILDIEKELRHEMEERPEILEYEKAANHQAVIRGNRLVRELDEIRTEVYKTLYEEGFDIMGRMGKSSMSKSSIKMIRSTLGVSSPQSKKEMKAMKKRAKKERLKMKKRADSDSALERVLLGNKINMNRDENGNITMRLKDLYRDD